MMKVIAVFCGVLSFLAGSVVGQPRDILGVTILSSQELKDGIDEGKFNVILDVRRQDEWVNGHIPGATFAENLGSFGGSNEVATPSDLMGCENCNIAVYCQSGNRASSAIQILLDNGFKGQLYNGRGTGDWVDAGFDLVDTPSTEPPCLTDESVQTECKNMVIARENGGVTTDGEMVDTTSAAPLISRVAAFVATLLWAF